MPGTSWAGFMFPALHSLGQPRGGVLFRVSSCQVFPGLGEDGRGVPGTWDFQC